MFSKLVVTLPFSAVPEHRAPFTGGEDLIQDTSMLQLDRPQTTSHDDQVSVLSLMKTLGIRSHTVQEKSEEVWKKAVASCGATIQQEGHLDKFCIEKSVWDDQKMITTLQIADLMKKMDLQTYTADACTVTVNRDEKKKSNIVTHDSRCDLDKFSKSFMVHYLMRCLGIQKTEDLPPICNVYNDRCFKEMQSRESTFGVYKNGDYGKKRTLPWNRHVDYVEICKAKAEDFHRVTYKRGDKQETEIVNNIETAFSNLTPVAFHTNRGHGSLDIKFKKYGTHGMKLMKTALTLLKWNGQTSER